ncbi:putative disease resistance protein RGA3 [Pistacia vera]|uniref:putative disease resistance protein RGA3 n=1 Tax=Pistacia vera TaxID=55513 RepID=UPI0012639EDA|nr:putative disease resistance protein RGA3 [Pistacia vera]
MAESFPLSIATNILTRMVFLNFQKASLSWDLPEETKKLQNTLSKIKADLFNVQEQQAQIIELRSELATLSDLLYDVEDMVDELESEVANSSRNTVYKFLSSIKFSKKIKEIRKRLEETTAVIKSKYDQNKGEFRRVYSGDLVMNYTFVNPSEVFGRDVAKENIIDILMKPNEEDHKKVSIISIVGMGGTGKTTLAKLVYNEKMIDEHFDLKMWVHVPEDFDIITLMKETYSSATGESQVEFAVDKLEDLLLRALVGKKFFLVLDDVWNENYGKWEIFKHILTLEARNGSKMLVTTRSNRVAKMMGTVSSYVLEGLSEEESMKLFAKWASQEGEFERHEDLCNFGREIARKCSGIPLAVTTLGTLLYGNKDTLDWLAIRDSDMWELKQEEDGIIPALKLSYAHLPSHLRRCLAYCSLFPKDYCFNSNYLIHYWMAHGFLATNNEDEELEDVGLRYLKELISKCFFQDVEDHGYFFTFKMHDLIHDLVVKMAQKDCKTVDLRIRPTQISARHLSILGFENYNGEVPFILSKLLTIIMQSLKTERVTESFINTWTTKYKYLRLLCLSGLQVKGLPNSVGALKHLRYLDLSRNSILKELPNSICKLQSLQTLRLERCSNLQLLPNNLPNLISLRYLDLTTIQKRLPRNGIECLTSLRSLLILNCDNLESLPRNIARLTKLKKMVICSCPKLNLERNFPEDADSTLQYIRIEACTNLTALPASLSNLTSLQELEILSCPGLSSLPDRMQNLTNLKKLKIQKCPELSESCRQNWSNISHVPEIHLDPAVASESGNIKGSVVKAVSEIVSYASSK